MGFFRKFFGDKEEKKETIRTEQNLIAFQTEQELIERFGGLSLEKQIYFGEDISDRHFQADISKEQMSFGEDLVFSIQVLGTFSHANKTWLWSWANTQSGLSESITSQALKLKEYGEKYGIDLLTNSDFPATSNEVHLIGLIASGMFNASAYFMADYGQGEMLVMLYHHDIAYTKSEDHQNILIVFPQLISLFEMNHRTAFQSYATDKGYVISENGTTLIATKNGQSITAEFDELFRLTSLNG